MFLFTVAGVRADHLPWHGYERDTAPWAAGLAERGAAFTAARSTSAWTLPAMGSILTGELPHQLRLSGEPSAAQSPMPDAVVTVAERLRPQGYTTYGIVSAPGVGLSEGFGQGFDHFVASDRSGSLDAIVAALVEAIADRSGPVFVWVHLSGPLAPYERRPWTRRFAPDYRKWRVNASLDDEPIAVLLKRRETAAGEVGLSHLEALYDAEIRNADEQLSELASTFRIDDGDVVAFTSDHGQEFRERGGLGAGRHLHAEITDVPLIIAWPNRLAPRSIPDPVSIADLTPTLSALVGAPYAEENAWLTGISLVDVLESGEADRRPRPVMAELFVDGTRIRSLWAEDRKLVVTGDRAALYDPGADPAEQVDLAGAEPERVEALRAILDRSFARPVHVANKP